jgi:hypothetical protein
LNFQENVDMKLDNKIILAYFSNSSHVCHYPNLKDS